MNCQPALQPPLEHPHEKKGNQFTLKKSFINLKADSNHLKAKIEKEARVFISKTSCENFNRKTNNLRDFLQWYLELQRKNKMFATPENF